MRIDWFAFHDPENPRAGGAERTIEKVGSELARRGHKIRLTVAGAPGMPHVKNLNGVEVVRWGRGLPPVFLNAATLSQVPKTDVIVDDLAHAIPWSSSLVSRAPGIAFFHHLHARTLYGQVGPLTRTPLRVAERLYSLIYRKWKFVTESRSSAADLEALGIPNWRVTRIPPGVDTALFKPGTKTAVPKLVYFGGLRPYKRPDHFLEVVARLSRTGHECVATLVGEGPEVERLKLVAQELGIQRIIQFPGKLSDVSLAREVSESWLNVHCSVAEGWGFSISEACAAGVPTVAYDTVGTSESIKGGETGILVQNGNVSELAKAAEAIVRNPDYWFTNCAAPDRVRDWSEVASDWEQLLANVADENGT